MHMGMLLPKAPMDEMMGIALNSPQDDTMGT